MATDTTQMSHREPPPSDLIDRRDWIVAKAKRNGKSLRQIGKDLGITHQAVAQGLRAPSLRVEQYLADLLLYPVQQLFPERYRPDGTRLCLTRELRSEPPPAVEAA